MAFNPLHAYLEKHLASLLVTDGILYSAHRDFRNLSIEAKTQFVDDITDSIVKNYETLFDRLIDENDRSFVRSTAVKFIEKSPALFKSANIVDINSLSRRQLNFSLRGSQSLPSLIGNAHISLFGSSVITNIVRINALSDNEIVGAVDTFLADAAVIEEDVHELMTYHEKYEKLNAVFNPDGSVDADKAFELAADEVEDVMEEGKTSVTKKLLGIFAKVINDKLMQYSAPVEAKTRGFRSCVAAELMGFLEPDFDINTRFDDYAAYMLLMLDLYPFRSNGLNYVDTKETFTTLISGGVRTSADRLLIRDVHQHLRTQILENVANTALKCVDPAFSSNGASDFSAANVTLFRNKDHLNMLDKLIQTNSIEGRDNRSTINSRLIAQFVQPLLRGHREFDMALIDTLVSRYKDMPGVSKLTVCRDIKEISKFEPFAGEQRFEFLKRIRPTGELELFAYKSPDTQTPLIRAMNSLDNIGTQIAFGVNLSVSGDVEAMLEKLGSIGNIRDALKAFEEAWKDGDFKASEVARAIIPNYSQLKRIVNSTLQSKTLYFSDERESLQKLCGDLSAFGEADYNALSRDHALELMDILLLCAEKNVLDVHINKARESISVLRDSASVSEQDINRLVKSVVTPDLLAEIDKFKYLSATTQPRQGGSPCAREASEFSPGSRARTL